VTSIKGSKFDDVLIGNNKENYLYGLEGDDMISVPGSGYYYIDGGEGINTLSFLTENEGRFINLETGKLILS
jgi:hypothetical protein